MSVEYWKEIEWRNPIRWPIFGPYVLFYLATPLFYWFPLALLAKPLWYAYGALFVVSTVLNVTSHQGQQANRRPAGSRSPIRNGLASDSELVEERADALEDLFALFAVRQVTAVAQNG
jgi:hypothetical protein